VLDHPDPRNLVEGALVAEVAIVLQPDLAAVRDALLADLLLRILVLVAGQRDAQRARAEFFDRPEDERAPAAPDVEQALARPEAQLGEDVVELLLLGALEIVGLVLEVSAGVDHVAVEEERVELVRDVVVVLDRLTIVRAVVPDGAPQRRERAAAGHRAQEVLADAEGLHDRDLEVDVPLHVSLAEGQEVGREQAAQRSGVGTVRVTVGPASSWLRPFQGAGAARVRLADPLRQFLDAALEPPPPAHRVDQLLKPFGDLHGCPLAKRRKF
jgi:hypothetical protein